MADGKKTCCEQESNLKAEKLSEDLVVKTCQVCECRHFELTVDPGQIGITGASL